MASLCDRAVQMIGDERCRRRMMFLALGACALGFVAGVMVETAHGPAAILAAAIGGVAFKLSR